FKLALCSRGKMDTKKFDGIVLMGPFGAGKSYLGRFLHHEKIGTYSELEPVLYEKFSDGDDLDTEKASAFIRQYYFNSLSSSEINMPIFESTGLVQRPLLLEVMKQYELALVKVVVSKEVSLERVAKRNAGSHTVIEPSQVSEFYDNWMQNVANRYKFSVEVDGSDVHSAAELIKLCIQNK
ncbi:hypothetical protein, partial [Vibrio sp. vnigr-6D03]|uniref:hypothetical protein n=1 Tax=Vibrio sp. vnigr-6D03 TaxID=2058088 RepID=UPI001F45A903